MGGKLFGFDEDGAKRIVDAVRSVEKDDDAPPNERRIRPRTASNVQFVRCTSATPTGNLYPAVLLNTDGSAQTYSDGNTCWLYFADASAPTATTRYPAKLVGIYSDNKAVFLALDRTSTSLTSLTVKESDGSPSYSDITEIQVDGAVLTQPSAGKALITVSGANHNLLSATHPDTTAFSPSGASQVGRLIYSATSTWTNLAAPTDNRLYALSSQSVAGNPQAPAWKAWYSGAQRYRSSNQSVNDSSDTTMNWNGTLHDTESYFSSATQVFVGGASVVELAANVVFDSNATGYRKLWIINVSSGNIVAQHSANAVNGDVTCLSCSTGPIQLGGGATFEVHVYQNSGGALNVFGGTLQSNFGVKRLRDY